MKHLLIILSILFFHSQLYGINLSCDFEQILEVKDEDTKKKIYSQNGVFCSDRSNPICVVKSDDKYRSWISEVKIKNKGVLIINEQSNYEKGITTKIKKKLLRIEDRERGLMVESIVHQKNDRFGEDRYIFVIKDMLGMDYLFYTLFFDNLSKKSILTKYNSVKYPNEKGKKNILVGLYHTSENVK